MTISTDIKDDRPLTTAESELVRWLLEHGVSEASAFLPQLDQARVASRCGCGCASIDFAIDGVVPPIGAGMQILADYVWSTGNEHYGVFVFARRGLLAGLEVWSVDGLGDSTSLPDIDDLRPMSGSIC